MKQPSLLGRAIWAVVLMVGFYVLAIGIAGAMLWLAYAQVALVGRFSPKLVLICVAVGGTILWSILPRPDRFEPPGPQLLPEDHPRLFEVLRDVAARTGQAMPAEVYLVNDTNAFVAQRGGVMGFFSKRVMGLGLPLLQVLTVSQLRAVLAHEFGHFHGGDTRLGPFIYKTRAAIGRTIVALAEGGSSIMHKPFEWYGEMFLKITQAISRRQELAADALAARVVGAVHLIEGLKVTHGGALAFDAYWRGEYLPAVASGFKPPLARGFEIFLTGDKLANALRDAVKAEMESGVEDPYDTHPPLPRRIEALEELLDENVENDERHAIELLTASEELEHTLLESVIVEEHMQKLVDIRWADVAQRVYIPRWKEAAGVLAPHLEGLSARRLPRTPRKMAEWALGVTGEDPSEVSAEDAAHFAAERLGAALATALVRRGWAVRADIGEPFVFEKDGHRLEIFKDLHALAAGELEPDAWVAKLEEAGVARLRLLPKPQSEEQLAS